MRDIIDLACTVCKQRNYTTRKNKKNDPDRLERNKFCKFCRKHIAHKEVKQGVWGAGPRCGPRGAHVPSGGAWCQRQHIGLQNRESRFKS